jgi:CheY-like chemotaxis protein/two-component sensor histidine kinase
MNSILGMADLLMETPLGDEQRRYLNTVISNGRALLDLINSILDLAKVESGRISLEAVEFNPRDVAEKVLETLAIRAHEKSLDLMVRFAPEVPELALGDPLRLSQILINLVGNAIKFTQQGQVLLTVEHDPDSVAASGLKFTVSDSGIGIPANKRHLLFKPFSQADSSTSRKYGGSGLGLAIVSRLVALMQGKVTVASEPGTGSAFSFTAQFAAAAGPALSESSDRAVAGAKVLLVDDNSGNRSIVSELLTARGANVTQASSATGALAELRGDVARDSHFQVVLLDGAMPARGSFEVAECLMGGGPNRPRIVMMLGTNDLTTEVGSLRAIGVDNYIVKPVRRAELFAAVARARAGVQVEARSAGLTRPAIEPAAASAILDRPLQILMADDSDDNRALIRAYLKKTPYQLEEAEDGRQAIDKFIAGKFDLVLMDIQMPIVDGYEATSTIRDWERANDRRRTPIVALTASALDEAVHRTKAAGCDAHVTKPVRKATLLDAIRDAVEMNQLDDERVDVNNPKEATCLTE